jgi:hypothetical protein
VLLNNGAVGLELLNGNNIRKINTLTPINRVINVNDNIDISIDLSLYYDIIQVDNLLANKQNLIINL